jgi:predicted aspartyl protease
VCHDRLGDLKKLEGVEVSIDLSQNRFGKQLEGGRNLRNSVRYGHSQTGNGMRIQPGEATRDEKPRKQTMSTGKRAAILGIGLVLVLGSAFSGRLFGGLGYSQKRQAQSKSGPIEVPFEFVANQVIVEVKIAGKGPYYMLVDTDTDPSAIDLATAKELGLGLGSKSYPASGGGNDANVFQLTRLPTVELGALIAKDVVAGAIDLSKLSARLGKPIQGVLGYSFLKDRIIQIDYPETKIRFFTEFPYPGIQTAPNTVNKIALPLRYDDGVIIDSVFINAQKMKATLDTGSSSTFSLTPEAVTDLGLEEQAQKGEGEKSVGYNGEYESKSGLLKSVRIGRLAIDSAPAVFWSSGTGHDKKKFQVNIGNGFFKDFIMTFDFRGKVVVFERVD